MNLKSVLGLLIALMLGFATGIGLKLCYETKNIKPYFWNPNSPPVIANCYGSDFSKLQMIRAIDYWTIRGEDIGFYEHNPPESVCEAEWLDGFIILRKSHTIGSDSLTLASTRRYTSFKMMRGAVIFYSPGSQNLDLINEHELGHALGYSHLEVEGHIMHPHYNKMGRDFWVPVD